MRNALLIAAACTALSSQAAIWEFDLGPATGQFGLNGANERPTPTASPATGRELQDYDGSGHGIRYDDSTKRLELHFGWGSHPDVGGTDLSSDFLAMHIHGPANIDGTADVLYNL